MLLSCFCGTFTPTQLLALQHLGLSLLKAQGIKTKAVCICGCFPLPGTYFPSPDTPQAESCCLQGFESSLDKFTGRAFRKNVTGCLSCHIFPLVTAVSHSSGLGGHRVVIFMLFCTKKCNTCVFTLWSQPTVHKMSTRVGRSNVISGIRGDRRVGT